MYGTPRHHPQHVVPKETVMHHAFALAHTASLGVKWLLQLTTTWV